ncbi:hypothetical protein K2173_004862 [Erythroxylum novogranatense]|uniref:Anthranilate synthase n=1 Tax=Erythroxylum novogranatense TaxID=1862640 RepID=A0AAV8TAW4_9ROSI|nr:hypothetical protein K2173_004862 [Erythroxylum novogranatense]
MEIVARENIVTIMDHREGTLSKELVDDPWMIPRTISESWKPQMTDRLPDTFCGGWIGYFSYDTVRHVQKANLPSSRATQDDINLADMHLGLYVDVIVLDHVEKKAHVIHWVMVDRHPCVESAYSDGVKCLEKLVSKVHDINPPRLPAGYVTSPNHQFGPFIKSKLSSKEYSEAVERAKEHIVAGDVSQIVLSQGFERPTFTAPFEVYRAMRVVSPDHCMTYLQARGCILVASSPEVVTCAKKVSGELRHNVTCWDVLRAALPVCTVCGTPKIMAMKVTDKPEMTSRGPCGGGFVSISFNGDVEIAVDSRIMVFPTETQDAEKGKSRRQWIAYLQAGATICVDTDPESEYCKCQSEVAHVAQAIDLAETAFIQGQTQTLNRREQE